MMEAAMEKEEKKRPVVLWISRHRPVPAQLEALMNKLGPFELVLHVEPLSTAEDAVRLAEEKKADYIVPVLPLSFIARLVEEAKKRGFTVLRAEMDLIHTCASDLCPDFDERTDVIMRSRDLQTGEEIRRHYRFREFVKLKAVEIVTEKW